jgi:hypothetical protein
MAWWCEEIEDRSVVARGGSDWSGGLGCSCEVLALCRARVEAETVTQNGFTNTFDGLTDTRSGFAVADPRRCVALGRSERG